MERLQPTSVSVKQTVTMESLQPSSVSVKQTVIMANLQLVFLKS